MASQSTFKRDYRVRYDDIDRAACVSPLSILNYFEDIGIAHCDREECGAAALRDKHRGWFLLSSLLEIDRYPSFDEKISAETWISSVSAFQAYREYILYDTKGDIVAHRRTRWALMNLEKRCPEPIPDQLIERFPFSPPKLAREPARKIDTSMLLHDAGFDVSILRSDIDTNGHVNNVRYVDWHMESVSAAVYEKYQLRSMESVFIKEIIHADGPFIRSCRQEIGADRPGDVAFLHAVYKSTGEKAVSSRSRWRPAKN